MNHPIRRAATAAVLALAVPLGLTACGEDTGGADASAVRTAAGGETFNDADVDFAGAMIPHHAQAVQMVVMAQGRDLDPEVRDLMDDIREAQVPEIELMSDWLVAWGEEVPATSLDHANAGHDMHEMHGTEGLEGLEGMEEMPGMMSADDLDALDAADDATFERMWLEMMIAHHAGAVEMAETEIEAGENDGAQALAEDVVETQQAEIEAMQELLERL